MSKSPIIVPTIGRRVWFWPDKRAGQSGFISHSSEVPMDAGIVFVHNDRCVNLDVCDHAGNHHAFTSVYLEQGDDCPHDPDAARCEWMPFQKGQAAAVPAPLIGLPVRDLSAVPTLSSAPIQFDFGDAIRHVKEGRRVARAGWNGKGMFIFLNAGSFDAAIFDVRPFAIDGILTELFSLGDKGTVTRLPNLNMRAASGATVTGWLASQSDMLAEDWMLVE